MNTTLDMLYPSPTYTPFYEPAVKEEVVETTEEAAPLSKPDLYSLMKEASQPYPHLPYQSLPRASMRAYPDERACMRAYPDARAVESRFRL